MKKAILISLLGTASLSAVPPEPCPEHRQKIKVESLCILNMTEEPLTIKYLAALNQNSPTQEAQAVPKNGSTHCEHPGEQIISVEVERGLAPAARIINPKDRILKVIRAGRIAAFGYEFHKGRLQIVSQEN